MESSLYSLQLVYQSGGESGGGDVPFLMEDTPFSLFNNDPADSDESERSFTLRAKRWSEPRLKFSELARIIQSTNSTSCADCNAEFATFISTTLGITLCRGCVMEHLSTGHLQIMVRPIRFYDWRNSEARTLACRGNEVSNLLHHHHHHNHAPGENEDVKIISKKYTYVEGMKKSIHGDNNDVSEGLSAVRTRDINALVEMLMLGKADSTILMHEACKLNDAAIVNLLLSFGASVVTPDADGHLPIDHVSPNGHEFLMRRLCHAAIFQEHLPEGLLSYSDIMQQKIYGKAEESSSLSIASMEKFMQLLSDTMTEIEARSLSEQKNHDGTTADNEATRKLSSLNDFHFKELCGTVFEELRYRELFDFAELQVRYAAECDDDDDGDNQVVLGDASDTETKTDELNAKNNKLDVNKVRLHLQALVEQVVEHSKHFLSTINTTSAMEGRVSIVNLVKTSAMNLAVYSRNLMNTHVHYARQKSLIKATRLLEIHIERFTGKFEEPASIQELKLACFQVIRVTKNLVKILSSL